MSCISVCLALVSLPYKRCHSKLTSVSTVSANNPTSGGMQSRIHVKQVQQSVVPSRSYSKQAVWKTHRQIKCENQNEKKNKKLNSNRKILESAISKNAASEKMSEYTIANWDQKVHIAS